MIKSLKQDPKHYKFLVLLWFCIPLLRVLNPKADVFGSIRQFVEFLPSLAIIASVGAYKLTKFRFANIFFAFYIIILLVINVKAHPNQNAYYNFLAPQSLFYWQTTYDNPYRQGVNFLNEKAQKNAQLAYLDGTMEGISPIWLRPDIRLGSYFSGNEQKGEYIISIVYPAPPKVSQYLYLERFLNPIYEIKANDLTIAKVYQNAPNNIKEGYRKTISLTVPEISKGSNDKGNYWQIDFGKTVSIVSLTLEVPQINCTQKDGLFFLNGFFIPESRLLDKNQVKFSFSAEPTNSLRFYGIDQNSCLLKATVQKIETL